MFVKSMPICLPLKVLHKLQPFSPKMDGYFLLEKLGGYKQPNAPSELNFMMKTIPRCKNELLMETSCIENYEI
jgi:hypothetical protein